MMHKTWHKRSARRFVAAAASVIAFGVTGIGYAGHAAAAQGIGCETIHWGFFGAQRRTICDTPKRPDGSWTRAREIWVPAGYVPQSTYCYYGCTSSGGYYRERGTVAYEEYVVFDSNVLPDEPGWLPTGSVVIR